MQINRKFILAGAIAVIIFLILMFLSVLFLILGIMIALAGVLFMYFGTPSSQETFLVGAILTTIGGLMLFLGLTGVIIR